MAGERVASDMPGSQESGSASLRDLENLRHLLCTKVEAEDKAMTAMEKHIADRLEQMNELREQINTERTKYISRQEHDTIHQGITNDIRELRESRAELAGKASMVTVFWTGVIAVLSMLIGSIGLVMSLVK